MPILMFDQNLDYVVLRLEDVSLTPVIAVPVVHDEYTCLPRLQLLPLSFGPEHLQIDRGSSSENASARVYA